MITVETFLKDLKYSLRVFRESPTFTLVAVTALALGIGANASVFSLVNAVLLKPLTAPEPERIVQFMNTYPGGMFSGGSPQQFFLWREQNGLFQDVSAHRLELINLTGGSDPEQVPAARATADFFHLFGVPVLHGRAFTADEDRPGGGQIAMLSYGLWVRRFGGDPQMVGKTISINGSSYRVVGIVASHFNAEQFDQNPDLWIPFQMEPGSTEGGCYCRMTARLKPGITLGMAKTQLGLVAEEYRREFPKRLGPKQGFTVLPLREAMIGDVRPSLLILVCAVACVLLIACANVANLLLARATVRKREIAIRAAVGAGRARIIRQLLTESVVLAVLGGALGLAIGFLGIRTLLALYPSNPLLAPLNAVHIPRVGEQGSGVALDWRVATFTMLVSMLTAVLFGLIPALQASRADLTLALKESSGRSGPGFRQNKTRALLVISEIALALVLLVGAALLIRASIALRAVNPGFDSHNVLVMQMSLAGARFEKTTQIDQLIRNGVQQLHALPGTVSVASSCCVPLETVWQLSYIVAGRPYNPPFHGIAGWTFVSPEYFDAFKIPVVRGRPFTTRDDASAPGVVIINQALARRVWPNSDPLDDRLIIGKGIRPEYDQDSARQVVGIVGDIRDYRLDASPRPAMYVPVAQLPDAVNALNLRLLPIAWIVRTSLDPHSLATSIKEELRQATGLPVARIRSMDDVASQSIARPRFNMVLMTIFGSAALLLAAIGIYGLMAYSVQQRTQEIGIRLALGADSAHVRNMIVLQGMRLAVIGILTGIAAAFGLTRLIAGFLFSVKAWDAPVFVSVPLTLAAIAFFAVWLPARRATRIDPVDALRYE